MKNDGQRRGGVGVDLEALVPRSGKGNNGIIANSFKSLSGYLKFVSSGASTVAASVRSVTSSTGERDSETSHDQVLWAGFDKLELERGITLQVLLLGYGYGFQVWDVEVANCVHNLVSRNDGCVSFMQMSPKPISSEQTADKFSDSRPLLIICADGSVTGDDNFPERSGILRNGSFQQCLGPNNSSCASTVVWFYSLRSQSYVHLLRFRSVVHLVRCSSRVVAVLQSAQVHCFDALKLERQYTILTNPIVTVCFGSRNKGFGPLAVGPRWMAYSGTQVEVSKFGRVSPQIHNPSASFPNPTSNGSLVAHYAIESSKQLAAGILTLGDIGYKKLSRYYSDLLPEDNNSQSGTPRIKVHSASNGFSHDADSVGMVIVRDIVRKTVIAQFRAHKSPILSLCFDPSGTLLVTASVQGHNINVFRIMPGLSGGSSGAPSGVSYVHLYRLQRGFTNAVIQDISFSSNSNWIMISSSRGTSHLFAISPSGGLVSFQSADAYHVKNNGSSLMSNNPVRGSPDSGLQVLTQQNICASGPPLTLSAVSRIRNGNNGWKNSVSGAAAAATGRISPLSGAIASVFHNCKGNDMNVDSVKKNYHLLVFSPSGCLIQYALRMSPALNGTKGLPISTTCESNLCGDSRIVVEAMQKWDVCQKKNREESKDNIDMYGENRNSDSCKVFPERMGQKNTVFSSIVDTSMKQNIITEERHRMHICEAELQMHQIQIPLWARSEIYFQSMLSDVINTNEVSGEGEIEIERVPICVLEARPKDLVPVFDYLQAPKSQQGRSNIKGHLQLSENGAFTCKSSSSSFDPVNTGEFVGNKVDKDGDEAGHDGLQLSTEKIRGVVNTNNDSPLANARLEILNTGDHSENNQFTPLKNIDCLKMENKFAETDRFDLGEEAILLFSSTVHYKFQNVGFRCDLEALGRLKEKFADINRCWYL